MAQSVEAEEPPSRPFGDPFILVEDSTSTLRVNVEWLRHQLQAAIEHLPRVKPLGQITILLADDQRMSSLHRQFMSIDSPTDVLTFDLSESAGDPHAPIDAEIALGLEVAQRQAAQRGYPVERELLLYAIHGLLHLLGFDDHDEQSYNAMHAEEDRILTAIGVGATFSTQRDEGASST